MHKKTTMGDLIRKRIEDLQKEKNLTINAIAVEGEIKPSSLQSFMKGASNNPTIKIIEGIANGLDMSVVEFLDFYPFNEKKSKRKNKQEINNNQELDNLRESLKEELKKELLEEMKKSN